jgi:glycosyltransferase involved in cell wall biosynthesis
MPKVALFYDWLNQWGGAEKVLLSLIKLYPDAPVFTLVHNPQKTPWLPKNTKIITSFIDKLPFSKDNPVFYTPIYDLALEQFDFSQYDIVISTTSVLGHCLLTSPQTLFVCYYHNLNRHLYNSNHPILKLYQKIDTIYSQRPDYAFCNSQTVQQRLKHQFNLHAQVIHPGIDTNFFKPTIKPTNDFFLIVSRLVPHKNIDVVIKTFQKLPYRLAIIGTGRQSSSLKKLAQNNSRIKFLDLVSPQKLLESYQNCQALICPQLEDFGLAAIEAQACGKPVIALGIGGNTETVVNRQTGIFFDEPTVSDITDSIDKFLHLRFNPTKCRQNSLKFSDISFMLNFKKTIDNLWPQY